MHVLANLVTYTLNLTSKCLIVLGHPRIHKEGPECPKTFQLYLT